MDRLIKIAILTDAWTPVWGGGQKHIWEVASRLANEHNCQIDLLVPNLTNRTNKTKRYNPLEKYAHGKLQVYRLGKPFIFPNLTGRALFLVRCLLWLLKNDYDIVHSHAYQFVLLPLIKLIRPKTKVVYTLHGTGVNLLGGGILNAFKIPRLIWELFVYHYRYDLLCSVAKSTVKKPVVADKFAITPNGVNVSQFDKVKASKNPKYFKILWVGRAADPVKGVKFLQDAVAKVRKSYPEVKLVLVTKKFGTDLIKEYKSSDLFALPSLSEGLPLVLLEAMAAKLPIVCTDVGDCREIINQARSGIVVSPGNAEDLACGIEKIYLDPKRELLGENGYRFVQKHFRWEKVAAKIYSAYRNA